VSTPPRLIVQHTPKCAGSSLRRALVRVYGADQIFSDTKDRITSPRSLYRRDRDRYFAEARAVRPTQSLVIGHFPISKYAHLSGLRVATLRHPVRRAVSHYFWLKATKEEEDMIRQSIRAGDLELLDFVALPQIAGFYRDYFFRDSKPDDFDLLIFAERFPRGLRRLSELIGAPLTVQRANTTAGSDRASADEARRVAEDPRTISEIRHLLADEIAWFQEATRSASAAWN
jgi:hypothetical protein